MALIVLKPSFWRYRVSIVHRVTHSGDVEISLYDFIDENIIYDGTRSYSTKKEFAIDDRILFKYKS